MAEYWKNEAVYQAGNTESSTEQDARGELDKGAFDTVSRATTNHGLHRGNLQQITGCIKQTKSSWDLPILSAVNYRKEQTEPAAGTVKVTDKVEYKVTGSKKATVNRCTDKSIRTAKIQDTVIINGYTFKVTGISDKAFYGCKKLTTVTIGSGVSKIGKKAFSQCTAVKTITIRSTSLKKSSVGSAAFKGIKNNDEDVKFFCKFRSSMIVDAA